MTMTFKEALIAHLQGQKVQASAGSDWMPLAEHVHTVDLEQVETLNKFLGLEFRLAPRTILVNGVEVPAPESDMPKHGVEYFLPSAVDDMMFRSRWNNNETLTREHLQMGIVYLDKESAIARSKAMLITQEVK